MSDLEGWSRIIKNPNDKDSNESESKPDTDKKICSED